MPSMARRISSPAFVGRSEQLGALSAALTRAGAGEAGVVLIGGESGVGKSRLLAEFERLTDPGEARFLAGACVDVGGSELPYSPIVAALRPLGRETDTQAFSELVGPGSAELAPLLPALPLPDAGAAPADPMAQSRLFEALLGLLDRLARAAPVVLVIEDIHWADPSTRSLLAFLARNVRTERLASRRDLQDGRAPPPSPAAPVPGGGGADSRGRAARARRASSAGSSRRS